MGDLKAAIAVNGMKKRVGGLGVGVGGEIQTGEEAGG